MTLLTTNVCLKRLTPVNSFHRELVASNVLSAQQQTTRVTLRRRGGKHRCFYGDRGLKSYCTSVKESARMLDCLLIKERTGAVFVRVCLSCVAMVIRSGQCQERLESRGQTAESTFKRLLTRSTRMNLFKKHLPSRLWEQIRKIHVEEVFFIWWRLKDKGGSNVVELVKPFEANLWLWALSMNKLTWLVCGMQVIMLKISVLSLLSRLRASLRY